MRTRFLPCSIYNMANQKKIYTYGGEFKQSDESDYVGYVMVVSGVPYAYAFGKIGKLLFPTNRFTNKVNLSELKFDRITDEVIDIPYTENTALIGANEIVGNGLSVKLDILEKNNRHLLSKMKVPVEKNSILAVDKQIVWKYEMFQTPPYSQCDIHQNVEHLVGYTVVDQSYIYITVEQTAVTYSTPGIYETTPDTIIEYVIPMVCNNPTSAEYTYSYEIPGYLISYSEITHGYSVESGYYSDYEYSGVRTYSEVVIGQETVSYVYSNTYQPYVCYSILMSESVSESGVTYSELVTYTLSNYEIVSVSYSIPYSTVEFVYSTPSVVSGVDMAASLYSYTYSITNTDYYSEIIEYSIQYSSVASELIVVPGGFYSYSYTISTIVDFVDCVEGFYTFSDESMSEYSVAYSTCTYYSQIQEDTAFGMDFSPGYSEVVFYSITGTETVSYLHEYNVSNTVSNIARYSLPYSYVYSISTPGELLYSTLVTSSYSEQYSIETLNSTEYSYVGDFISIGEHIISFYSEVCFYSNEVTYSDIAEYTISYIAGVHEYSEIYSDVISEYVYPQIVEYSRLDIVTTEVYSTFGEDTYSIVTDNYYNCPIIGQTVISGTTNYIPGTTETIYVTTNVSTVVHQYSYSEYDYVTNVITYSCHLIPGSYYYVVTPYLI